MTDEPPPPSPYGPGPWPPPPPRSYLRRGRPADSTPAWVGLAVGFASFVGVAALWGAMIKWKFGGLLAAVLVSVGLLLVAIALLLIPQRVARGVGWGLLGSAIGQLAILGAAFAVLGLINACIAALEGSG